MFQIIHMKYHKLENWKFFFLFHVTLFKFPLFTVFVYRMHRNPGSGGPQNASELSTDGDYSLRQPKIQTHFAYQKNQFPVNFDFSPFNNSMDPRSYQHSSPGSMSMETKRREQRMADLWSHSNGVSQSQFLSVVRELKKTQNALKEALKKPGIVSVLYPFSNQILS